VQKNCDRSPWQDGLVKTTIEESLFRKAQARAAELGQTLQVFLAEALQENRHEQ
jgi:hypothetical protein